MKNLVFRLVKPPIQVISNSYSQSGEDLIISFLLRGVGMKRITYLELGVCSPDSGSNTYKFYLNGSRGVLVEADETLVPNIKKVRPEDRILNFGVGLVSCKADFYIFDEPSLNTFSKREAEFRISNSSYRLERVIQVALKPINDIIAENFEDYPTLLSIDIEGLDLAVLESLNVEKYPVPIICAETCSYSENHVKPKKNEITDHMSEIGYFPYADTYINTIFVNEAWFNSFSRK
jgi:hypothetical protein